MRTLNIRFRYRVLGEIFTQSTTTLVDVETDSNDKEIDEEIKWYFREYIDHSSITEVLPYEILKR